MVLFVGGNMAPAMMVKLLIWFDFESFDFELAKQVSFCFVFGRGRGWVEIAEKKFVFMEAEKWSAFC